MREPRDDLLVTLLAVWQRHGAGAAAHHAHLYPAFNNLPSCEAIDGHAGLACRTLRSELHESRGLNPEHRLAAGLLVVAKSVVGGLHHEYSISATPAIT